MGPTSVVEQAKYNGRARAACTELAAQAKAMRERIEQASRHVYPDGSLGLKMSAAFKAADRLVAALSEVA